MSNILRQGFEEGAIRVDKHFRLTPFTLFNFASSSISPFQKGGQLKPLSQLVTS